MESPLSLRVDWLESAVYSLTDAGAPLETRRYVARCVMQDCARRYGIFLPEGRARRLARLATVRALRILRAPDRQRRLAAVGLHLPVTY